MSLKLAIIVALVAPLAAAAPHRSALLIGINDYTASRLPAIGLPAPGRDWPNLAGSVNDVTAMRELLMVLHGFDAGDIVTLSDQSATRSAILTAANRLAAAASKDDVVFVYFAGHGSQVENSRSDEPDKLDESIIPADSRRGAPDIRDKDLRRIFNAILDRGARLTVMIDACHSGSGARGLLTLARRRGIRPDLRDVADGRDYGPRPENRGALVMSAAHDDEEARETRDHQTMHGAFTWAWMRAMRDAAPDESAMETFARAQARLRAEMPFQSPVIAGNARERRTPFLAADVPSRAARMTFAVERVRNDGIAVISGGWAHGITEGSELRVVGDRSQPPLTVTALLALSRCEARVPATAHIRSGMLLELSGWAATPPRPLRVAIPRSDSDIAAFARRAAAIAAQRGLAWIDDPTVRSAEHVVRRNGARWEILDATGHASSFVSEAETLHGLARLNGSVFVQLPAPTTLAAQIAGPAVIEVMDSAEDADYVLAGRFTHHHVEYAWVRPNARRSDRRASGLPLRSTWIADAGDTALVLRNRALKLHKIEAWSLLESPPDGRWPYHLALRGARDQKPVGDGGSVEGNETYTLELRSASRVAGRRHVYIFTIDSYGQSTLIFPVSGSVENHFPLDAVAAPPPLISLGVKFAIAPPYGVDTYFLLATDEPLTDPSILQWDGVRNPMPSTKTPLERLLALTGSTERGASLLTPSTWSIERIVIESSRPRHKRARTVSVRDATSS